MECQVHYSYYTIFQFTLWNNILKSITALKSDDEHKFYPDTVGDATPLSKLVGSSFGGIQMKQRIKKYENQGIAQDGTLSTDFLLFPSILIGQNQSTHVLRDDFNNIFNYQQRL